MLIKLTYICDTHKELNFLLLKGSQIKTYAFQKYEMTKHFPHLRCI